MIQAEIYVVPKKGVLDPQGSAVKRALDTLGFDGIQDIRIGKYIKLTLDDSKDENVDMKIKSMCEKLLANEVIEDYFYKIEGK
jgi:phosphoribosylformylglycinamidine synthase subunit PurS